MALTKRALFRWLSRIPGIGNLFNRKLDSLTIEQLTEINQRFSKASVRFAAQIQDLYDCLKPLNTSFDINPRVYLPLPIELSTKSSKDAHRLVERVLSGYSWNPDEHFVSNMIEYYPSFLDWYSNGYSLDGYYQGMVKLMELYCALFPVIPNEDDPVECHPVVENFLTSRWFRLMVIDLIKILTLVLIQRRGG